MARSYSVVPHCVFWMESSPVRRNNFDFEISLWEDQNPLHYNYERASLLLYSGVYHQNIINSSQSFVEMKRNARRFHGNQLDEIMKLLE